MAGTLAGLNTLLHGQPKPLQGTEASSRATGKPARTPPPHLVWSAVKDGRTAAMRTATALPASSMCGCTSSSRMDHWAHDTAGQLHGGRAMPAVLVRL